MAFWDRNKKLREAELANLQRMARDIMAREPTEGPNARPWYERRTTKPYPDYQSKRWEHWRFESSYKDTDQFVVPEQLIGTVFPGDEIRVNGEWRKVMVVHTDYNDPVIRFEPHPVTFAMGWGYEGENGNFHWTDPFWDGTEDQTTFYVDGEDRTERDIAPGDWVLINNEWRRVTGVWSDGRGYTMTFVVGERDPKSRNR